MDSPLEGDGFEPSVPRQRDNAFRDSSFPTSARATAAFENARRSVQQLLLPVLDPVRMSAELQPHPARLVQRIEHFAVDIQL